MIIRNIGKNELEVLESTAARLWHQRYDSLLTQGQIAYMLEKFQSVEAFRQQLEEGYLYRGLFNGEELIGFSGSVIHGDRIFLSKLYLDEAYHGRGLGRMLLEDVFSQWPACDELYLTVNRHNPSVEFYRHVGFETEEERVTDIGNGYVMDDYVMRLSTRAYQMSKSL